MSVAVVTTANETATRAPIRKYYCAVCTRFVFESTAEVGKIKAYCFSCRRWHWFTFGDDGDGTARRAC